VTTIFANAKFYHGSRLLVFSQRSYTKKGGKDSDNVLLQKEEMRSS
jgi:hypothetical protein